MDRRRAWTLIETIRVATLGTLRAEGSPHLVPCVFSAADPLIYIPVDTKPKRTRELTRVRNIEADPRVVILVHNWAEDWSRLWWVRLDGHARVLRGHGEMEKPRRLLVTRYTQYTDAAQLGPVIAVEVQSWTGWEASDGGWPDPADGRGIQGQ